MSTDRSNSGRQGQSDSQATLSLPSQRPAYSDDSGIEATTSDLQAIHSSTTTNVDVFGGEGR